MNFLKKVWRKLPKPWRAHAVSFTHTFIAAFVCLALNQLINKTFDFSTEALFSLAVSLVRAALKMAFAKEMATSTGSTDNSSAGNTTVEGGGL